MLDRRTLLAAAAALPVTACAPRGRRQPRRIRLATLNIWHDAGNWPVRRELIAQALRAADAHVIALQEVLQDSRKQLPNQAQTLADLLGGYAVHFAATAPEAAANRYGNAILSRLPVIASDWKKLEPLNDHRTALRVRVDLHGRPVDLVTTHLAWEPEKGAVRSRQLRDLLGWLPRDGAPLAAMGDFNAPLEEPALAELAARGLESALPPGAVDTTLVAARGHAPRVIDHIFVERSRFDVLGARRFADAATDGETPSDHFGILADVALR